MISIKNSKSKKTRHIFIISDATGSTCEMVVKAALSQFRTTDIHLHRVRYVRTEKEIKDVVQEVMAVDGIIAYTLVSNELRDLIFDQGRKWAVPAIDVMVPYSVDSQIILKYPLWLCPGCSAVWIKITINASNV